MDGDVLFANSTCFDDALMSKMSKMAEGLKPGAIFVTFTKGLVTPGEPHINLCLRLPSYSHMDGYTHRSISLCLSQSFVILLTTCE